MASIEAGGPHAARWGKVKGMVKKKGRAGVAAQPKSREETPKVGTPWRAGPNHSADLDMGVFVLRCNLTLPVRHELREIVAGWQRVICQMATFELWLPGVPRPWA